MGGWSLGLIVLAARAGARHSSNSNTIATTGTLDCSSSSLMSLVKNASVAARMKEWAWGSQFLTIICLFQQPSAVLVSACHAIFSHSSGMSRWDRNGKNGSCRYNVTAVGASRLRSLMTGVDWGGISRGKYSGVPGPTW